MFWMGRRAIRMFLPRRRGYGCGGRSESSWPAADRQTQLLVIGFVGVLGLIFCAGTLPLGITILVVDAVALAAIYSATARRMVGGALILAALTLAVGAPIAAAWLLGGPFAALAVAVALTVVTAVAYRRNSATPPQDDPGAFTGPAPVGPQPAPPNGPHPWRPYSGRLWE